jgi:hypothetical protein
VQFVAYYLILFVNVATCWSCLFQEGKGWRTTWVFVGLAIASLPLWLPPPLAFFYGLLGNVTMFFWSADTFMGKGIRRLRGIVGGLLLFPLPFLIGSVQASWAKTLLLPTLGHLLVSAGSWPIVVRILARLTQVRGGGGVEY